MDAALANMAERVGSKNFTFVITAVTIQRQIGGSLAGLFDMVAETVRQRQQFAPQGEEPDGDGTDVRVRARRPAVLPRRLVTLMNPLYMSPLWHTGTGQKMVVAGS